MVYVYKITISLTINSGMISGLNLLAPETKFSQSAYKQNPFLQGKFIRIFLIKIERPFIRTSRIFCLSINLVCPREKEKEP